MKIVTTDRDLEAFYRVLDLIVAWQDMGRCGFALPVINGELLEMLEELADKRRKENCSFCNGTGKVFDGYANYKCAHCETRKG